MSGGAKHGIRLFISDLDGTLVDKKKQLTPGTIAAVARLKAAGIGFTVISARPRSGVMPIVETLKLDVPIGAFNGGTIFKRDGTVLSQDRIPSAVVKGIFEMAQGLAVAPWLFADDRWFALAEEGPHFASERVSSNQAPVVVEDFSRWYDHADKITFVSDDPPVLAGLLEKAQAAYGDQATIGQSQTYYLDVTATPANKGDGIVALAESFGVPLSQVAVIGDQFNDLPMFARAAVSIAMGQAPDGVKAKAQHVTAANDADGVAQAIDSIILA
jgi:Cof subfamily protein (haloacid dehalogenase superfamily)